MKKWLFLTALTALLLGACSTENEVSQENTDKQIGFVQKEDKNSLEKAEKEKLEKEKKEKEEQEKEKKTEEERKLREEEERKKQEEERKVREEQERRDAEAKQIAEQAEATVQQLENNQVAENISPAQAAVERVADPTTKADLTDRIGRVQNAINISAQQAAEAEQARQAAESQIVEQQESVAAGGYFKDYRGRWHRPNGQYASKKEIANAGLAW
ncbi:MULTISPECIES: hypothetical protein [Streptococcus]|uniref:hypothetical protein n=1 Tax=Streptococcus TaxID=1301 RepID=UPI000F6853FA|nr:MULTISPECIES: hypothetical protein [Streptococcus]MBS6244619.1 hypothetical protein [Streptococcus sp.]RSJ45844.1 hypothetical protein D8815_08770 [Streptococcus gordonii]RSJ47925.1 hypothetical protein D8816_04225 [Streptococcus gordonii]RSJ51906.1 hypothetical protein D8813_02925 [Streptococcus gordonii]